MAFLRKKIQATEIINSTHTGYSLYRPPQKQPHFQASGHHRKKSTTTYPTAVLSLRELGFGAAAARVEGSRVAAIQ